MNKKSSAWRVLIVLGCIVLGLVLVVAGFCFLFIKGSRGNDFARYQNYGGTYRLEELPEGAQDFRYSNLRYSVGAQCCAAFTLNGDDYDNYVNSLNDVEMSPYGTGHDKVGKRVSEVGFPDYYTMGYVIDDDIDDYLIIYYDHANVFCAVLANPDTGRIVVVSAASR